MNGVAWAFLHSNQDQTEKGVRLVKGVCITTERLVKDIFCSYNPRLTIYVLAQVVKHTKMTFIVILLHECANRTPAKLNAK